LVDIIEHIKCFGCPGIENPSVLYFVSFPPFFCSYKVIILCTDFSRSNSSPLGSTTERSSGAATTAASSAAVPFSNRASPGRMSFGCFVHFLWAKGRANQTLIRVIKAILKSDPRERRISPANRHINFFKISSLDFETSSFFMLSPLRSSISCRVSLYNGAGPPPRGDGRPGERGPAARCCVPPVYPLHDPRSLLHVLRPQPWAPNAPHIRSFFFRPRYCRDYSSFSCVLTRIRGNHSMKQILTQPPSLDQCRIEIFLSLYF